MKNTLIPVVAVLALFVAGLAYFKSAPAQPQPLGTSSTFNQPDLTLNGLSLLGTGRPVTPATTTPYAVQSPNATSTLMINACRLTTASSSATTWTVAKAATQYATTTLLQTVSIAAAAQASFVLSTSTIATQGTDPNFVFAPNTWLVVSVANGVTPGDATGTGFQPRGTCDSLFLQI